MPLEMDEGMKELLDMDKDFKKLIEKVLTNTFRIAVGSRLARGGGVKNQFILNNFKRKWDSNQRTYTPLTQETENAKTTDYFLVESGDLMESVRNTIKVKLSGRTISASVTVPNYGVFNQHGTLRVPPRPFFTLDGVEKEFYGLIESQLTLEFNRLGIKSKEI